MLIVFDATDGSGKSTQVALLLERLQKEGYTTAYIKFPQYGEYSAGFIERYLQGEYGSIEEAGPYEASLFYAMDRYAAKKKIQSWLEEGKIVVVDRYVSGNQIHQAGKIHDPVELENFLNWLDNLEFEILKIPRPDVVLFLNVPPTISQKLVGKRKGKQLKLSMEVKRDIHEENDEFMLESYRRACSLVKKYDYWREIVCTEHGKMLSIEVISEKIWGVVEEVIGTTASGNMLKT